MLIGYVLSLANVSNVKVFRKFYRKAPLLDSNFIKKRLQHRCFLVLRTPILENICQRLLLLVELIFCSRITSLPQSVVQLKSAPLIFSDNSFGGNVEEEDLEENLDSGMVAETERKRSLSWNFK